MSKKNRKQLKKEKRNQRRNKERMRKLNLFLNIGSSSVSYSSIKYDRFGKISRFVNQRGSVLFTDTEMFGCEIVRDLPDYVYDFVKQIGFDSVISVPISNHNGLTGSGKKGECHRNSQMLSLSIGGHRICGLVISIYKHKKELCFMHGHSVWNTPEGKTRCVTNYQMREGFRDKLLTKLVMGETLLFVPVGMNDVDNDNNFCLDNFIIYEGDDSFCLQYNRGTPKEILENQEPYVVMIKDLESKLENRGHIFSKFRYKKRTVSNLIEKIKSSYFTKVSLFTGRSWDFYKNEMVNIIQNNTPSKSKNWGGIKPQSNF